MKLKLRTRRGQYPTALALGLAFSIAQLTAATFVVDDTGDALDTDPGNGVCRTSTGTCSLRAAIQEANARPGADAIQLPGGVFMITRAPLNANDITTGDLDITDPLTITGAGASVTIIDGGTPPAGSDASLRKALDRLFELHPTAGNVTISSLTLREGWDAREGGALFNASPGTVRLVEVHVLNSVASSKGGAIYHNGLDGGRLVIERSTIAGNATGGEGGGIYLASGSLIVTGTAEAKTTIADNIARNGGGIYNGGALTLAGLRSRVDVTFTTLSGNTATNSGGGVCNGLEGEISLTDVTFTGNTAAFDGGGVASVFKTSLAVMRGTFSANTADAGGGGVFTRTEGPVTIQSSAFAGNSSGVGGGGALFVDGRGTVTIAGSTFSANTAAGEGGAIAIHSSGPVEISDSIVRDNTSQLNGGGVLNSGFGVNFTRLTITGNAAIGDGGGIDNQSSSDFVILDTSFDSNRARNGGGLHNTADGPLSISDTSFLSNSAENGGGFYNVADKPLSLNGCTFWDNRAQQVAGGFLHRSDAATEIVNTTLSGNSAGLNGGGLYLDGDAGLHVINTTITRNSAPYGSGVGTADAIDNFPIVSHPLLLFRNTIVAGNLGGPDCHAAFGSEGGNLDGGSLCNFQGPRDRANVNPGLPAIADNGGPTLTHALSATSPAVGGGVEPCLAFDQRGVPRELNRSCDIGAYEFEGTPELPSDLTHPETVLNAGPADTTENGEATFAFSASEPGLPVPGTQTGVTFECSLDGVAFAVCISPLYYAGLSGGTHTFEVRALLEFQISDLKFEIHDPTPASYTWLIELPPDTTPPETTIGSTPAGTSESREATFTFSSEPGATFECSLDGVSSAACTSPVSYVGLSAGAHSFSVVATDAAGNHDPTPASHTWTVDPPPDSQPPETTITSGPAATTENTEATFIFTADEPGSAFECAQDGVSFNDCASPVLAAGLSAGTHTFAVRAIDPAGNVDPTPASYPWTINPPADTTPPETLLASGPASPTEITSAPFTFGASETGSTFACALDGEPFAACASPVERTGLTAGNHTFAVRAIDLAGNVDPTPASFTWLIEPPLVNTHPIHTTIISGPPSATLDRSAGFTFSASESNATFACALDGGAFAACVSPTEYTSLQVGDHTFEVRAMGTAGNVDTSPAAYAWTILPPPPFCGPQITVAATADAWIDENSASANKGGDAILKVQSKSPNNDARALLQFALPDVSVGCVVESATLRFYAGSASADRTLEAIPLADGWTETGVAWDNQPDTSGPAAGAVSHLGHLEWIVTSQVQAMYDTESENGFLIRDANEGDTGFEQQFYSREKSDNPPALTIAYAWRPVSWATPPDLVYGTALDDAQLNATAVVPGTFTYHPPAGTVLNAGTQSLVLTFTPDDPSRPEYVSTNLINVLRKALTITAEDKSQVYGAALSVLTASYSGLVNGDTPASLDSPVSLSTTASASSPVGSYGIKASGASDANYTITHVDGTLTVSKAALTITAEDKSKVYGAALPVLTASYSGLVNGDAAASLDSPVSLSTTASASSPVGSYGIKASGASDANYTITHVDGTLTVSKAALTITAEDKSKMYGAALPVLTASYSGLVNGDAAASLDSPVSSSTAASARSPVGSYSIRASGASDANYSITHVDGTLTVSKAALTITAENKSKVYGAALPALTASYAGLVNGDKAASLEVPVNLRTMARASSPVGSYSIRASGASDANYIITHVDGTLTVSKAALTITAQDKSKVYGAALPALTASYSGLVNGDTAASLDSPVSLNTTASASSPVGSYSITASGASDGHYTITQVNGTLTVIPAPSPNLTLSLQDDGSYLIQLESVPGINCRIEYTETLSPADWRLLGSGNANASGLFKWVDAPPRDMVQRFYRSVFP